MNISPICQEATLPSKRRARRDPEFGRRLQSAMAEAGISPGALAKRFEVTPQTVSRWRRGELPEDFKVPVLAEALGVRTNWLKTGGGERTAGEPVSIGSGPVRVVRETPSLTYQRALDLLQAEVRVHAFRGEPVPEATSLDLIQQLMDAFVRGGYSDGGDPPAASGL